MSLLAPPTRRRVLPVAQRLAERARAQRGHVRRRRARWAGGALAALLLVGLASWLLLGSPLLALRTVEVSGTSTVTVDQVRATAAVVPGTPLARLDLGAVRARLAALGPVDHVRVARAWPHTLQVRITERTPVAVLHAADGSWVRVDATGARFSPGPERPAGLPELVTTADVAGSCAAAAVLAGLPDPLRAAVTEVEESASGSVSLQLRDGPRIVWGTATGELRKAEVVQALLPRGGSVIDVTAPDLAVVRQG